MSNSPSKSERIHALDSLRAVMMLLGLVLHSALTYGLINYGRSWPIKDPQFTTGLMDWLSALIHIFRMPLFFIIAGFFGALLFYKRGAKKMISNRLDRILYPFIVFLLLINPIQGLAFNFTSQIFSGTQNPLALALSNFGDPGYYIPDITFHLWFLYYLMMITLISFGFGLLLKKLPDVTSKIKTAFEPVVRYPLLKLITFSFLTFILLLSMGNTWVATSLSFEPDIKTLAFYSYFYLFGWILYKSRQPLEQLKQFDWLFTVLALPLFTLKFIYRDSIPPTATMALNALLVWMFSFGITGLFIRYGSRHSARMRYVSDASYWFYLIHLPLTMLFPGLLVSLALPAVVKFILVLALTTLVCALTYHYLVRSSFIGKFLNGRKYPRSVKMSEEEKLQRKAA